MRPQVAYACVLVVRLGATRVLAMELGASTLQRDLVAVTLSSKYADQHQLPFVVGMRIGKGYEGVQGLLEAISTRSRPQSSAKASEVCRELDWSKWCIGAL